MGNQNPEMEVAVLSEKGRRDENQDWMSWTNNPWGELFIIADGMGGYKGGAIAARMTVEGIEKHLTELPTEWPFVKALQEAVRKTNEAVHREAHSGNPETEKMGSTVVVALVSGGSVQIGHIGDSRAYLVRKKRLQLLTKDHTVIQRMLDAGMITPKQARNHPDASVLNRAIGSKPDVEIEVGEPIMLEEGDSILLCSDGLSGFVEDRKTNKVLRMKSPIQDVPQNLKDLALKTGSDDNITIQFIRFGKTLSEPRRKTARLPILMRPDRGAALGEALLRIPRNRRVQVAALLVLIFLEVILLAFPTIINRFPPWSGTNPVEEGQPKAPEKKGTTLPAEKGTTPPAEKGTTPPAEKGTTPPAEKGTTPPAEKGTTPPAEKGTTPPAEKGTTPPAEKGTAPPAEKGTAPPAPPAEKGTTPPAEKGTTPPAEKGTTPPAEGDKPKSATDGNQPTKADNPDPAPSPRK